MKVLGLIVLFLICVAGGSAALILALYDVSTILYTAGAITLMGLKIVRDEVKQPTR